MHRKFHLIGSMLLIALLVASTTSAQQLPKTVAIGSNPAGSLFYALGSGLAKVVSEASPIQAQIQPYASDRNLDAALKSSLMFLNCSGVQNVQAVQIVPVVFGTAIVRPTFLPRIAVVSG